MTDSLPLLLLIDGHSLAFRAYYALNNSRSGPFRTASGIPTSVCFGFLNSLLQVIGTEKPDHVAIAFDRRELTFRHQADANYKANRAETPEDFLIDVENLQELLTAFNLAVITAPGYEADDLLATVAQQAVQHKYRVKILTGDRDLFQLVDSQGLLSILYLDRSFSQTVSYQEMNAEAVFTKLGVKPSQVVDYKSLCGDSSDNIPGVKGIGHKTAVSLLQQYDNLDNLYNHLAELKGTVKTKLEMGKEAAYRSRHLAQLIHNAPLDLPLSSYQLKGFNINEIYPLLTQLELKSFLNKITQIQTQLGGQPEPTQLTLFSQSEIYPTIINTPSKLKKLITTLKKTPNPVAWDTETTSLDPKTAQLVGIGCCWDQDPSAIAYIPLHHTQGTQLDPQLVLNSLRPILENSNSPKVFQNTKFDREVFWYQGIKLAGVVFDTMLASYVLNPDQSHNLKSLCRQYLKGITAKSYEDLGIGKNQTIADLDLATVADYCGLDAYTTWLLVKPLEAELKLIPALEKLLREVELPLEAILAQMEITGITLDLDCLQQLAQQIDGELKAITEQAYQLAGEAFNLDSPKQLGEILFEKLGLNRRKSRKTKTGYSTDHATLEKLEGDHPLINLLLQYRTLAKLKSTYVDALPQLVSAQTGRIHTNFNQTNTATGRLSSSNPNLQNIPIRTSFSRQIRQAFIPQKDWLLVSADYSQIELRILAHLSEETILIEAYKTGQDIHSVTAKLLFEKSEITPEERRLGKVINFGVIYGMGAQKFAREARVDPKEAKIFIDKYQQRYQKVFDYLNTVKKQAIAQGFVLTILGRRRYFNFSSESLKSLRGQDYSQIDLADLDINYNDAQLLRGAANAPIQGSSADIIKIAMVKLEPILANYQAKVLLQVHDELVLEVPPAEWSELQPLIQTTMENVVPLRIPLVVELQAGKNWLEAK